MEQIKSNVMVTKTLPKKFLVMNTKFLLFILAVFGSAVFTACETKRHCPGFPNELSDYFPYQENDTLTFVNQRNDTISTYVESIQLDEEWSYDTPCFSYPHCSCGLPHFYCYTQGNYDDWVNYLSLDGQIVVNEKLALEEISIWFKLGRNSSRFVYRPKSTTTVSYQITLKDEWGCADCYLIVTKGKGITKFRDVTTNNVWTKIP